MRAQIDLIGDAFRGLWKSMLLSAETLETTEMWSVTYIYGGQYVETPYKKTPEEALSYVIKVLHLCASR